MGFFSGITNVIGNVFSKGVKAASEWGGKAVGMYTAAKSGNILSYSLPTLDPTTT